MLGDHHIFADGHFPEEAYVLKRPRYPETADPVRGEARNLPAGKDDASPRRCYEAGEAVKKGRFPGAVRSDNAEDYSALQRKTDLFYGPDAAEVFREVPNFQEMHFSLRTGPG